MSRLRIIQIVSVEWIDSESFTGWDNADAFTEEFQSNFTCGYLIHTSKTQVVIANSFDPMNDHFNCVIKIPIKQVVKIDTIHSEGFRDGKKIKRSKKGS